MKKNYTFLYCIQKEFLVDQDGNVLIFQVWEEGKEELDKFSFILEDNILYSRERCIYK